MISSLTKIARETAAYAAEAQGDSAALLPATNTRIRTVGRLDNKAWPSDKIEQQLEAFRGTTYAAVDKIARRFAQLNWNLFTCEHDAGKNEIVETRTYVHPFNTLFSTANGHRPHEEFSVWELKYTWAASIDMTGEAWWLVERDKLGRPARITPLPANRMTVVFNKDTGLTAGYMFVPKGATFDTGTFIPRYTWEYLHNNPTTPYVVFWRYPSPRGIEDPRGWSPVKAAAYAYDINLYEQIYKKNFLEQGAQLGGILQSEIALSKEQIEEYLDQFKIRHQGINKAGLPMVLPKMLKWETTEPTPRDMQWAEAINMTQSQILQIYGISDAKLGRADIGNRNTADAMDVTFNREVIQARCDTFNSKMNSDFMPIYPRQTDTLYLTSKCDDPVPADTEMQMKKDHQDLTDGVVLVNELREKRGEKPFGKYGEMVWKQVTMTAFDPHAATLEIAQDDGVSPQAQLASDEKLAASKAKEAKNTAAATGNTENKSAESDQIINTPAEEQKEPETPAPLSRTVTLIRDDEGRVVSAKVEDN